jgi:hypothetical protein
VLITFGTSTEVYNVNGVLFLSAFRKKMYVALTIITTFDCIKQFISVRAYFEKIWYRG